MEKETQIVNTVKELLGYLPITVSELRVDVDEKTGSRRIVIATPDSAILIGEHGARLQALNHLVKRIAERLTENKDASFFIDVNDYQQRRINDVRTKAQIFAERARYFKSSVEMDPMSSYERMLVHAEFSNTPDIETLSQGEGKNRRVIIRYTEAKEIAS